MQTRPTISPQQDFIFWHTPCMLNMDKLHMSKTNISDAHHVASSVCYDIVRIGSYHVANIYKPPSQNWGTTNTLPVLPHPSLVVGDFNSHYPDWGYQKPDEDGEMLQDWASGNDYHLIHDSKQQGNFQSARWKRDYSPDLWWVSSVDG